MFSKTIYGNFFFFFCKKLFQSIIALEMQLSVFLNYASMTLFRCLFTLAVFSNTMAECLGSSHVLEFSKHQCCLVFLSKAVFKRQKISL